MKSSAPLTSGTENTRAAKTRTQAASPLRQLITDPPLGILSQQELVLGWIEAYQERNSASRKIDQKIWVFS
jgi:hypothetical protein